MFSSNYFTKVEKNGLTQFETMTVGARCLLLKIDDQVGMAEAVDDDHVDAAEQILPDLCPLVPLLYDPCGPSVLAAILKRSLSGARHGWLFLIIIVRFSNWHYEREGSVVITGS